MKNLPKIFLSIITFLLVFMTSCENEKTSLEPLQAHLPSLDAQVASLKSSLVDVNALRDAVDSDIALDACSASIEEQIASLQSGMPLVEAAAELLQLQQTVASVSGYVSGIIMIASDSHNDQLKKLIDKLDSGVSLWLGDKYGYYYPVCVEVAKTDFVISQIQAQGEELACIDSVSESLSESLIFNVLSASEVKEELVQLKEEIASSYNAHIKSQSDSDVDALNKRASNVLKSTTLTISDIIARIQQCEKDIKEIKDRLEDIEDELDDLMAMVQSLTFVSEYTTESVIAYYTLSSELDQTRGDEGKKARIPEGNITLNYLVRPASAASVLADRNVWNNGVKVIGYEAPSVQLKAVPTLKDFEILDVTADNVTGFVSVSVKSNFSDSFYFKEQGAKLALSVVSGRTDVTSKFVEVMPKDKSGKVYATGLALGQTSVSLQSGASSQLTATISPSDVTDKGCVWESSDTEIVAVDQSGRLTTVGLGEAVVTVTANATDEWGRVLSAQCNVAVTAGIRVTGPSYVEEGTSIELIVESPAHIDSKSIVWDIPAGTDRAYVDLSVENGKAVLSAKTMKFDSSSRSYSPISVRCVVTGEKDTELWHELYVIARQPKAIAIEGLAYNQNQVTLKRNETHTLKSSFEPSDVNGSYFRIKYQSTASNIASVNFDSGLVTAIAPGTAFIDVKVLDSGTYNYFYPSRNEMVRQVAVHVEPYWVTSVSLPSTVTVPVNPDNETTLSPTFTSDVSGKQPDDLTLTWSSSDPSVVSINEKTGAMVALKEGVATVTATTAGTWSVPSGQAPKTASCLVRVEEAGAPVNVGDFYYSDGTWSTQLDKSKTVIGVIFATASAATADKIMMKDYPDCTHGLVVGLPEYSSAFGQFGYSSVYAWLSDNGYETPNTATPNGYGLTKGMTAYRAANSSYAELFDKTSGPAAKQNASVASPASSWYIPSYYELKLIYENKSAVNEALSKVSATQILQTYYWSSTLRVYSSTDCQGSPFNMTSGDWYSFDKKTTAYPVRVVMAF